MFLAILWFASNGKNDDTKDGNGVSVSSMPLHCYCDKILFWKTNYFNNLTPIRQLSHPASAIGEIWAMEVGTVRLRQSNE